MSQYRRRNHSRPRSPPPRPPSRRRPKPGPAWLGGISAGRPVPAGQIGYNRARGPTPAAVRNLVHLPGPRRPPILQSIDPAGQSAPG